VTHPRVRFIAFTGSKEVGLRINETGLQKRNRSDLDQASVLEMGARTHYRRQETDLDKARSESSPPPSDSRARSARPAPGDRFMLTCMTHSRQTQKLTRLRQAGKRGGGRCQFRPVVSEKAYETILDYIELGKREGTC